MTLKKKLDKKPWILFGSGFSWVGAKYNSTKINVILYFPEKLRMGVYIYA